MTLSTDPRRVIDFLTAMASPELVVKGIQTLSNTLARPWRLPGDPTSFDPDYDADVTAWSSVDKREQVPGISAGSRSLSDRADTRIVPA